MKEERSFLKRKKRPERPVKISARSWLETYMKWGVGIGLILLATLLFPTQQAFRYNLPLGSIATETIVAPFDFQIYKNESELQQQRAQRRLGVPPVLEFDESVTAVQTVLRDSLFNILADMPLEAESDSAAVQAFQQAAPGVSSESILYMLGIEIRGRDRDRRLSLSTQRVEDLRSALERVTDHYFSLGVIPSKLDLIAISGSSVSVISGSDEYSQPISVVIDIDDAYSSLANLLRQYLPEADEQLVKCGYEMGRVVLLPNLFLNEDRTESRRAQAADEVALTKGYVMRDEKIIDAHTRVTEDVLEKLDSLNRALLVAEFDRNWGNVALSWLARLLLFALIFGLYAAYFKVHRPSVLQDNRTIVTVAIVLAVELLIAFLLRGSSFLSTYMVPVAVATMLLTVLFDTGVGLITAFVLGLLLGSVLGFEFQVSLIHVAAGAAGVFAVARVRKRSHFYRALWVVPLIYLIGIVSVEILKFSEGPDLWRAALYGSANGMLSVVITIGILPIFESLFNFSTDITLLELSDLNHPLLRQLAMRAPGTYQHSLMMGELGAAAAEACGANALLTRVGAYFHDIGKMNKPEYFVENQQGRNPHSKLSPHMSSLIVATHVKEGLEMADENRLPDKIKAFIPEHHGTMAMSYFYLKAVEDSKNGEKVSEDDFRYPGPKPRTRETGIVMLADAIEAASRVLEEPTPRRFRFMVKELVEKRFEDGELDECPLTLRDLRLVQEAFVNVLTSRFHQRIDYPDKKETLKKAAEREARNRRREKETTDTPPEPDDS